MKNLFLCLGMILFINYAVAEENKRNEEPHAKLRDPAEFQKVIDDYKAYVAKIPPEIRDEVITYRKEVAKINKQKRMLYKKLSQASQNYLKKEQQYKKKLPLNRKSLISIDNISNDNSQETTDQKQNNDEVENKSNN